MLRSTALFSTIVVGATAAITYALTKRRDGVANDTPAPAPTPDVRDAGPDAMANPPRRWDPIDQQADESFPASDPPGNY